MCPRFCSSHLARRPGRGRPFHHDPFLAPLVRALVGGLNIGRRVAPNAGGLVNRRAGRAAHEWLIREQGFQAAEHARAARLGGDGGRVAGDGVVQVRFVRVVFDPELDADPAGRQAADGGGQEGLARGQGQVGGRPARAIQPQHVKGRVQQDQVAQHGRRPPRVGRHGRPLPDVARLHD